MTAAPQKDPILAVNNLLDPRAVLDYIGYRTETILESEKTIRCFCPVHKEQVVRSLTVERDTKKCKCQYAPCPARKQVDMVGLVALVKQIKPEEAMVELAQFFRLNVELPGAEELLQKRLDSAKTQLINGNYEAALAGFAHVLSMRPESLEALDGTAQVLERLNKFDDLGVVEKRIAGIFLEQSDHQEAANVLIRYLRHHPADVEIHLRLAECYHHLGQQESMIGEMLKVAKLFEEANETDKALEIYRRVETIRPGSQDVGESVIALLVKVGRADEAIEQILPRARARAKAGAKDEALQLFEKMLGIDSTRDDLRMEYLQMLLAPPVPQGADGEKLVERCLPVLEGFYSADTAKYRLQGLQLIHRNYPDNIPLMERLMRVHTEEGRPDQAAQLRDRLCATYVAEGAKQQAENNLDAALLSYSRAAEMAPDSPEVIGGMLEVCEKKNDAEESALLQKRLAGIYATRKEYEKAIPLLEKYLRARPEDMDNRMLFVECLHALGRGGEMLNELKSVAQTFAKAGDTAKAIEIYQKISSINPDDQEVYDAVVNLLVRSGRTQEAAQRICEQADHFSGEGRVNDALACYRQVMDLHPERDDIRLKCIQTLITNPALKPADLEECLLLMDGFVQDEWSNMALQILEDLRSRFPGNIAILEKIHKIYNNSGRENDADALAFDLAQNLMDSRQYTAALKWVDPLIEKDSAIRSIALSLKADICKSNNDNAGAISAYQIIISDYESRGEIENALLIYESILEIDPRNLDFQMRRVTTMLSLNQLEELAELAKSILPNLLESNPPLEALHVLQKIETAIPPDPELLLGEAALLTRLNRDRDARQIMLRATDLFSSQNADDRAIEILEQLVKDDPNDLTVIEKLADSRLNAGQRKEALDTYRTLADLYGEQGSPDAQLDVLLKISQAQPDDTETLKSILQLYDQLENTRDAKELREKMVRVYLARKNYPEALQVCQEAIRANPTDHFLLESAYRIHEALGNVSEQRLAGLNLFAAYRASHDNDKAARLIDQLEVKYPGDPEILENRLVVLSEISDWSHALEVLDQLIGHYNRKSEYEKGIHVLRGLIARPSAPFERLAPTWFSLCRATSSFQNNWTETDMLITALEKAQKSQQAADLLREVIEEIPGFDPARERLIQLFTSAGLSSKAVEALCEWADIAVENENWQRANRYYNQALEIAPENIDLLNLILEFRVRSGIRQGASDIALAIAERLESEGLIAKAISSLEMGLQAEPARNDLRLRILALEDLAANPELLRARYNDTIEAQIDQQNFEHAHATLLEALRRFPGDLALRNKLVQVLKSLNLKEETLVEMANIAAVQAEMGNLGAALQTIGEVLEAEQGNLRAQALQAEIKERLSKDTAAEQEFRKILQSIPGATPEKILEMLTTGGSIAQPTQESLEILPILKDYRFENFIVGTRNNFAFATAMAVAKTPGGDYNPLFLYGDVGLGKTHLLHAIANEMIERQPDLRVLYTSSEEFTNALIEAIQNNTIRQFRTIHKSPDVFLIDDIHGLAEKERAQEEFFQIFNTLYQSNKQIVMTSDRPPKDIAHLERRLRSRFGAGIIVDIQPPDLETRVAILRTHMAQTGDILEDDIINQIAQTIEANIRELLSVLTQILARVRLTSEKPSPAVVRQIIDQIREH